MKTIEISAGYAVTIDDDLFEELSAHKWTAQIIKNRLGEISIVYARRCVRVAGRQKKTYMHRQILGVDDGRIKVDHRDHDGLNNRRTNLRISTSTNNHANSRLYASNTSGYKGVTWYKDYGKWMAQIYCNGKRRCLGYFEDISDAVSAYETAAFELFGEFAYTGRESAAYGGLHG